MPEPYLIAHLVRGEPAFDIAIRCTAEDGWGTYTDPAPWWLIPTSGHRAYPYWDIPLKDLVQDVSFGDEIAMAPFDFSYPKPPPDHPDHYTTYAAPRTGLITNLAERLGFVPKPTMITRR